MHVWPLYGAAAAFVLARSFRAASEVRVAAGILAADWALSNIFFWFATFDYRAIYQPLDFGLGLGFLMVWGRTRQNWMLAVSVLYLASGALHISYEAHGIVTSHYNYDLAINLLFVARLLAVLSQTLTARIAANMRSEKT